MPLFEAEIFKGPWVRGVRLGEDSGIKLCEQHLSDPIIGTPIRGILEQTYLSDIQIISLKVRRIPDNKNNAKLPLKGVKKKKRYF